MIEYTVVCDECSSIIDGSQESVRILRQNAILEGTLIRFKRKDYCFRCAAFVGIETSNQQPAQAAQTGYTGRK